MFLNLLGIALGRIIATQLVAVMPWQGLFFVLGSPSLLLTWMLARHLRPSVPAPCAAIAAPGTGDSTVSLLKIRNIWIATAISSVVQTGSFVFSTFVAIYLSQAMHLPLQTVGLIVSGWAFGRFIGTIVLPMLVGCAAIYGVLMLLFATSHAGAVVMFDTLFVAGIFGFGIAPLFLAVTPRKSVPSRMAGAAIVIPTIISGVPMPVMEDGLADAYGFDVP